MPHHCPPPSCVYSNGTLSHCACTPPEPDWGDDAFYASHWEIENGAFLEVVSPESAESPDVEVFYAKLAEILVDLAAAA